MDELDDIIGLLNSSKRKEKPKTDGLEDTIIDDNKQDSKEREKSVADRQLNIERMMNELEAMKKKKVELEQKNNALKESQLKPQRDYSNSMTRGSVANQSSAGSSALRKSENRFKVNMTKVNEDTELEAQEESKQGAQQSLKEAAEKFEQTPNDPMSDTKSAPHEPSKLDKAYEAACSAHQAINNISSKKFLIFRPYIDPMSIRPYKPQDKGYYFKFYNGVNVPLIRYTLEDNGFREVAERNQEWGVCWACSNIKSQLYQSLTKNQKVNHFPKSTEMTRKDCMYRHLARLKEIHGKFSFFDDSEAGSR